MRSAFANAARTLGAAPTIRAFRLKLQPLTLGHLMLLSELDSAFAADDEEATFEDVLISVFICSHKSAAQARKSLQSWWIGFGFRLWGWSCRRARFFQEAKTFAEYVAAAKELPKFKAAPSEDKTESAPLAWRVLAMLMADFGLSEEDALEMPLHRALILWLTEADRRGTIEIPSERFLAFREWVAQQEAAAQAQKGAQDGAV